MCAPWQGSRPAVAFPLQTTSAKGTERHHTAPDTRWLAGGGRGQGPYPQDVRRAGRDNTRDGIRIDRVAAAILDRSARSGMARCRLRADGESRVLASRTRSEGRPNGEHRSSHVGADLSWRRTDLAIPLSSRTLSTQTACGHHVIHNQPGEVCYVAPAARRDQVTTLNRMPRSVVKTTARQGGHSCHVQ